MKKILGLYLLLLLSCTDEVNNDLVGVYQLDHCPKIISEHFFIAKDANGNLEKINAPIALPGVNSVDSIEKFIKTLFSQFPRADKLIVLDPTNIKIEFIVDDTTKESITATYELKENLLYIYSPDPDTAIFKYNPTMREIEFYCHGYYLSKPNHSEYGSNAFNWPNTLDVLKLASEFAIENNLSTNDTLGYFPAPWKYKKI